VTIRALRYLTGSRLRVEGGVDPDVERAVPDGFQPEGIAVGRGDTAYLGSLADGDIHRLDLRTGRGKVISEGPGTPPVGVEVDRGRLFVAGGPTGDARVVDIRTGEVLATYPLGGGFVNDVVVTRHAAWFSDSVRPVIHKLPLGRGGALPDPADAVSVPITGDLVYGEGFNANGIEATPDGRGRVRRWCAGIGHGRATWSGWRLRVHGTWWWTPRDTCRARWCGSDVGRVGLALGTAARSGGTRGGCLGRSAHDQ